MIAFARIAAIAIYRRLLATPQSVTPVNVTRGTLPPTRTGPSRAPRPSVGGRLPVGSQARRRNSGYSGSPSASSRSVEPASAGLSMIVLTRTPAMISANASGTSG